MKRYSKKTAIRRYLKIWCLMTSNSIQVVLTDKGAVATFIFGKLLRFGLLLSFIYFLLQGVNNLLGYDRYQTMLFFLTFSFLGTVGQMFFREVYRFRGRVTSGDFDLDLIKPIHPLFRNLAGGFDFLDLLTIPIFIWALIQVISHLNFNAPQLLLYLTLSVNGLAIMMAIHILIAAFGVITTEVDHAVMVYRDLETMGRFPVDIYKEPLRQILTFVVPIGLMFTIPAKAILGLLSPPAVLASFSVGITCVYLAIKVWNFAVSQYTSASS